jgi:hypothetical protein
MDMPDYVIAALQSTWPPMKTWRGLTGSLLQSVYILWIISTPTLGLVSFVEFGALVLALFIGRFLLLRLYLIDLPISSTSDTHTKVRYRPIAYFVHRNYVVHVTGCLALMSADRVGAMVLLLIAAVVDYRREARIRQGVRGPNGSPPLLGLQAFLFRRIGYVVLICVGIIALASAPLPPRIILGGIHDLSLAVSPIQQSIVDYSAKLEAHRAFVDSVRFRVIATTAIIFLYSALFMRLQSSMAFFLSIPPDKTLVLARAPLLLQFGEFILITLFNLGLAKYGARSDYVANLTRSLPIYSFTVADAIEVALTVAGLICILWVMFGTLTQIRACRDLTSTWTADWRA